MDTGQTPDSHAIAVKDIVRFAGALGIIALVGILVVTLVLVTGWQPHGTSGAVQKDLSLVVLGSLTPIPGAVIAGLFGLLGRTGREAMQAIPVPVSGPAGPNDPVNVLPVTDAGNGGADAGSAGGTP